MRSGADFRALRSELYSAAGRWKGPENPNASASVTFDKAGTFDFFCEFHTTMVGQVVVK